MGNKLSCNCGPLTRKPYRYEDTPWSAGSSSRSFSKRDGHLLRLWAEVFHVTTAGGGTVKWQQVSEDLVPVNITCIQDSPEVVFHITAYNSQVDKILDVRLVQPGTRIGQASECFVYWKDPVTSDTWGLNFTSPIDAKQFKECCSPAFKFSRKASSSYSLKQDNNVARSRGGTVSGSVSRGGSGRINSTSTAAARRRPLSTPTSPSKSREPQCTCMTAEQYARLRAMDPRFRAASTLPRSTLNQQTRQDGPGKSPADNYASIRRQESKSGADTDGETGDRAERGGTSGRGRSSSRGGREITASKSVDYSDNEIATRETIDRKKNRSKSTDDVTERGGGAGGGGQAGHPSSSRRGGLSQHHHGQQGATPGDGHSHGGGSQGAYSRSRTLPAKSTIGTNTTPTGDGLTDSQTLKRLLKPIPTTSSVVTSPEMPHRIYHHDGYISEPEIRHVSTHTREGKRPTDCLRRIHERSRGVGTQTGYGKMKMEISPQPDHHQPVFDHAYYATTPPSSSPEDGAQTSPSPGSPTARLLLEYEQHLRNTLAKGMDAESYSLHTFEAIISQSNENLAVPPNSRSTTLPRFGLPTRETFRTSREASRDSRDSDVLSGYYSDFRDRGYLSDHNSRSSGYFERPEGMKSGYFSDRERSGYFSDREVHPHQKFGSMKQQASVESADSRMCYLTSSEGVSFASPAAAASPPPPPTTTIAPPAPTSTTATTTATATTTSASSPSTTISSSTPKPKKVTTFSSLPRPSKSPIVAPSAAVGERLAATKTVLGSSTLKPRVPPKPKLSPRPPPRGSSTVLSSSVQGCSNTLPKSKVEEQKCSTPAQLSSAFSVELPTSRTSTKTTTTALITFKTSAPSPSPASSSVSPSLPEKLDGSLIGGSSFSTFLGPRSRASSTASLHSNKSPAGSKSPSTSIKFIVSIPPSQTYLPCGLSGSSLSIGSSTGLKQSPTKSTSTLAAQSPSNEDGGGVAEEQSGETKLGEDLHHRNIISGSSLSLDPNQKSYEGDSSPGGLNITADGGSTLTTSSSSAATIVSEIKGGDTSIKRDGGVFGGAGGGGGGGGGEWGNKKSSFRKGDYEKEGEEDQRSSEGTSAVGLEEDEEEDTFARGIKHYHSLSGKVYGIKSSGGGGDGRSPQSRASAKVASSSSSSSVGSTNTGRSNLAHYDSIHELYSFVSEVLSSWESTPQSQQEKLLAKVSSAASATLSLHTKESEGSGGGNKAFDVSGRGGSGSGGQSGGPIYSRLLPKHSQHQQQHQQRVDQQQQQQQQQTSSYSSKQAQAYRQQVQQHQHYQPSHNQKPSTKSYQQQLQENFYFHQQPRENPSTSASSVAAAARYLAYATNTLPRHLRDHQINQLIYRPVLPLGGGGGSNTLGAHSRHPSGGESHRGGAGGGGSGGGSSSKPSSPRTNKGKIRGQGFVNVPGGLSSGVSGGGSHTLPLRSQQGSSHISTIGSVSGGASTAAKIGTSGQRPTGSLSGSGGGNFGSLGRGGSNMVTATGRGPSTTSAFYSPVSSNNAGGIRSQQQRVLSQSQLQQHQQHLQHQHQLHQQQQQAAALQAHYQNPSHLRFPGRAGQPQSGPGPGGGGGGPSSSGPPVPYSSGGPPQPSSTTSSSYGVTKYATFQPLSTPSDIYANAYANPCYFVQTSSGPAAVVAVASTSRGSLHQQHQQQQQQSHYASTSGGGGGVSSSASSAIVAYGQISSHHQHHPSHHSSQQHFHTPSSTDDYFYHHSNLLHHHGHGLLEGPYANYYQPAPSLTGHEEPISRPMSNLSNKSSEHFYTYPYQRKQQEQLFKPIDWCTLVHWARRVVQSRDDDNDTKTDCSHGTHEIKGLKRHEHQHSWPHVQPHECNVLFLAKVMQRISDDERMSLTTAVSDDEPGDGATSPKGSRKPAASFNCTGAVRKAGFLSVKKWLLRKRHQVELARRRGWKGYWVCLKGTTLLFYPCDAREARSVEAAPKHLIIVDGAIMQPIPEHPKRDYIFCLSTAFGDAYLFQAPCQVELESWVHSIHWACAAAFARHRGKTGTLHLLQEEIVRLDKAIESDGKLRHMAELQRSVVADPDTRQQLAQQIANWEENIERLHCEQFRLRCYMASLQGGELPNPKSLLSHVSRTTKNTLNRLGVFTVSSFHAFVCARSPSLLSNLLAGRGATKRRAPLLSRSNSASSRRSLHASSSDRESETRTAKISLPDNQVVSVPLKDAMSVEEFLISACSRKGLAPMEHFVRVKKRRELPDTNYFVPHRSDLIETYLSTHEVVEVRAKLLYQVELQRASLDQMWGFSVEAELVENADRQDELCCYVSRVEERSVAMNNDVDVAGGSLLEQTPEGIIKADEILVINGAIVSDLDMMYIESVLQEELSLCLMLRSSRTEPPALAAALAAADAAIAQLVCPPPPADPDVLTEDVLSNLIVPAPHENKDLSPSDTDEIGGHASGGEQSTGGRGSRMSSTDIDTLIKTAGEITGFCRTKDSRGGSRSHPQLTHQTTVGTESPSGIVSGGTSPTHSHQLPMGTRDVEKMKKAVLELVDTERAYVKHLTCLLEQYLEPLRHEQFLSATEMMAIFGNIREMVSVQRRFLRSLEAALESSTLIESINHPSEFTTILLNVAAAFLSFADHFKLYSSFCASHSKAQKLLHPIEGNQALQQFLTARNPKQQHSNTLESYLIKPIQRILKYPLLLQQIRNLCDTNSEEYRTLVDSLQCMERVAEHINEMQRIHEEYGAIFEHLQRQHQKASKTPIDLSPGDLLHYGGVEWLNIADFLGKIKKGLELHAMCFVFRTAVVFLCKERLRHKKKLMSSTSKISDKSEVEIIRYQVLIPVSEVQVRQVGDPKDMESNGPNYSWELTHLRSSAPRRTEKTYLLSNSTAEFRNVFLRNIRQIIRESVRNMSLPPRLPDGTGEGGEGGGDGRNGHGGAAGSGSSGSHYATPEGHEYTEASQSRPQYHRGHGQAHTLGRKRPPKPPQRHSAGNLEMGPASSRLKHQDSTESTPGFRGRSKTMSDAAGNAAAATDGEDGPQTQSGHHHHHLREVSSSGSATMPRAKGILGNTPNHLTLSTTSTLSAGSTGSAAKLIQSSATPGRNIPPPPQAVPEPSSPVWKIRDGGGFESATLPRRSDQSSEPQPSTSAAAAAAAAAASGSQQSASSSKTPPPTKAETLPRQPR